MTFIKIDYTDQLSRLIMERQNKTQIDGIEIILPKQGYKMTYKERLRDAEKHAKQINKLIVN